MASKRGIRRKSCQGKVRHETAGAAWGAVRRTYGGLRPYRCSFCGGFHIGHVPGKKRVRRK